MMRIPLGTFGLDVAELIYKRFQDEMELQARRKDSILHGSHYKVTMLRRGRGRRDMIRKGLYMGKPKEYHTRMADGMSIDKAQRIKLYLDITIKKPRRKRNENRNEENQSGI